MSDLGWYFPSTLNGETDGFKDAQLEHFQGNHEHYIAREAIQNAIDAKLDNGNPVSVVFEKFQMPVSDFPGHSLFKEILERCYEFNKGQDGEKFLSKAKDLMNSETITVLRIGDYNTCGLTGEDKEKEGHWNRLVKASGTSSSKGATGGSFGIGKGAPIAASRLRTVFYSTRTEKGVAFQGKARLTSHLDEKGEDTMRGVGFYSSILRNESIRNGSDIPEIFRRSEIGTDIFVMGYESIGNWEYKLAESVINNFWLPIHTGDLIVTIISDTDGKAVISKETLIPYIKEVGSRNEDFPKQVMPFVEAYTTPDKVLTGNLRQLGEVTLHVKKSEGFPRRVMMARKPKILVDKKEYRVLREPYAAIFLCTNDKGNAILREMEPPAHDSWDEDRYEGGGKKIWTEINDFIRNELRKMETLMEDDAQDVAGLDKFLPDSMEEDESFGRSAYRTEPSEQVTEDDAPREIPKTKTLVLTASPDQKHRTYEDIQTPTGEDEPGPAYGDGSPVASHGNQGFGSENEGEGGNVKGFVSSDKVHFRSFAQELVGGNRSYQGVLTAKTDCHGDLSVIAVGDDANAPISIVSASSMDGSENYEVVGSVIKGINIESGSTMKIRILLRGTHRYALTLSKHES